MADAEASKRFQESSRKSLTDAAISGAVWTLVQQWGGHVISAVVFVALGRLVAPEAFGLIALAAVFVGFLQIVVRQGFADALVQRDSVDDAYVQSAFAAALLLGLPLGALAWLTAGAIGGLLGEPEVVPVLKWMALAPVLTSLSSVPAALLRRRLLFRAIAVRSLIAVAIGGIAGVCAALAGWGVWSLVLQLLSESAAGVVILWAIARWRPTLRIRLSDLRQILTFGAFVTGANYLGFLRRHLDDLLIGAFLGSLALGYYSIGYRMLTLMTVVLYGAFSSVALPVFSKLQGDEQRLRRALLSATRTTSLLNMPAFAGMAVTADLLVVVLFGDRWEPSIPIMQILALIGIQRSCTYLNGIALTAVGRPDLNLAFMAVSVPATAIGFFIAVQWYGIVGVAASLVITNYAVSPLILIFLRRGIGLRPGEYLRQFSTPLCATALMVGAVLAIRLVLPQLAPVAELAVVIACGVATYVLALRVLDRGALRELKNLALKAAGRKRQRPDRAGDSAIVPEVRTV